MFSAEEGYLFNNFDDVKRYTQELNLLYVESDEQTRVSTVEILEQMFNNVVIATDGKEGLEIYEKQFTPTRKRKQLFRLLHG